MTYGSEYYAEYDDLDKINRINCESKPFTLNNPSPIVVMNEFDYCCCKK